MRFREAFYIGLFDALPLLRDPMLLFVLALISFLPVVFIFVFAGGQASLQALVGAIVLTLAFAGVFTAQSVYFNKHWFRFQDIFVASPVSPTSYAVGLSFGTLVISLPAVLLALGVLLVSMAATLLGVLLAMAASALLWLSTVFLGFMMGAATKNVRRANSMPQIVAFLLGFLPPVYYPLERLPAFLQPVAMLAPTTHAAQLAKYYFGLLTIPTSEILLGWAYLVGFSALIGFIAVRRSRWVDP